MNARTDILVLGAGLSGIGIASYVARRFPHKTLAILERRDRVGGTWDLFRYPGIRSDSDMFSYCYSFKPWNRADILAGADTIRDYIAEAAGDSGLTGKIRFGRNVLAADWDTAGETWTVTARNAETGETEVYETGFLIACTGYYRQDKGYTPDFAGSGDYRGRIVHPQHWPHDLDYTGKSVIVIGSGATAATLVPAMAGTAAKITLVQRSPSYFYSIPAREMLFGVLQRLLPGNTASRLLRWRNMRMQYALYGACRRWPNFMRRFLLRHVRKELGPDFDMRHFTPRYGPWDERMCILPEDDLFKVLRRGDAEVATGEIARFTERGLRLVSGEELEADIIVTATGFELQLLGGARLSVDGDEKDASRLVTYKGVMLDGIPNLAVVFGYINFTWTTKVDLVGSWLCRLFEHFERTGSSIAIARDEGAHAIDASVMNQLSSGYVQRGGDALPRQGSAAPWHVGHDYYADRKLLVNEPIDDGTLRIH
jgi:cation diffusion facilitator CzcD-associated flavoprotein CzcO